eukprot:TRINITY_DN3334_c0_g1_i3.p1 TRINITY_DN3334_c0_g1~~TRINITY_DN3334_c0_g1_i3.p1  ORF type:complete len:323 (+),score=43.07 TRINITY_DN3334_c0_g1_i3:46-969(+)
MELLVSFPDSGLPHVMFEAKTDTLVRDLIKVAANEWGIAAHNLGISWEGELLPANSRLLSHGLNGSSELTASFETFLFGKEWFASSEKTDEAFRLMKERGEQVLHLDTPTFARGGTLEFKMAWLTHPVRGLSFRHADNNVTTVSSNFLSLKDWMVSSENQGPPCKVDLVGLSYVRSIGGSFLSNFKQLTEIDLSSLSNVTSVGNLFLNGCEGLTKVNISGLGNLNLVGSDFLAKCSSVTAAALNLSSFRRVGTIASSFLYCCSGITKLQLSDLCSVTYISDDFLCVPPYQRLACLDLVMFKLFVITL